MGIWPYRLLWNNLQEWVKNNYGLAFHLAKSSVDIGPFAEEEKEKN